MRRLADMAKPNQPSVASVREKMRHAAEESGMTLEEIGLTMGFAKPGARQAVSRLLHSKIKYDPRLSTLIDFAKAVKRPLKDLIQG
jgi:transcriptional regulator with XRE-family HTH domain